MTRTQTLVGLLTLALLIYSVAPRAVGQEPSTAGADLSQGLPRFAYTVRPGDTLSHLIRRFSTSFSLVLSFNPAILSVDRIYAGRQLVIPFEFPLLEGLDVQRVQVCAHRFLGSYTSSIPFTEVSWLAGRYVDTLRRHGYQVEADAQKPLDGIDFHHQRVAAGRIDFHTTESNGLTSVDLGLLFRGNTDEELVAKGC